MTTNAHIQTADLEQILAQYDLGLLQQVAPLTAGSVQTNLLIETTKHKVVLRLYRQNRSFDAVRFEVNLINYLKRHHYPCPAVLQNRRGEAVGRYDNRPYVIFTFLEGVHVAQPTADQQRQLIQKVAKLQKITRHYRPKQVAARWNYTIPFCHSLATEKAHQIGTPNAAAKLAWYHQTLAQVDLPATHPKGICHADFHFSNVLFNEGMFHALLDFDDANYTYLTFDLVSLIEPDLFPFQWDNWQQREVDGVQFDFTKASAILATYQAIRPLGALEKRHLFDVLKLATMIDCLWYFERGDVDVFYEKRKIDCLDRLGRTAFYYALFGET